MAKKRKSDRDPTIIDRQELERQARKLGITVDELLKRNRKSLAEFLKGLNLDAK